MVLSDFEREAFVEFLVQQMQHDPARYYNLAVRVEMGVGGFRFDEMGISPQECHRLAEDAIERFVQLQEALADPDAELTLHYSPYTPLSDALH